jgi:4-hydroxybenzoyl-CoA thioesterase
MFTHSMEVDIEFGDCDPAGIVYFPNFFRFFDNGTAHMFAAALGIKKRDWTRRFGILGIPVVDVSAVFKSPSRFGDRVTIESSVHAMGRTSLKVKHRLINAGTLAVEGEETRVWIARDPDDPEKLKPLPIPDEVRIALGHVAANG